MCQPKSLAGVGIHNMRLCNQAYLIKLALGLIEHPDALWVKVLKSKYHCGSLKILDFHRRVGHSNLWLGICNVWKPSEDGVKWIVGNRLDVCF